MTGLRDPKVGIALAVYKPEIAQFKEQLESILAQTYKNWFCVLTLDSSLSELKKARELQSFFNAPQFIWNENPVRLGFKNNFSRAVQLSLEHGAELVACSDQDDVWYPEKIASLVRVILAEPKLSIVHSDMDLLVNGKALSQSAWQMERRGVENAGPTTFFLRNVVTGASMLMDAELARRFPQIPDEIEFHDWWFALVASFYGGVHPLNSRLYGYRQHDENVVGVVGYEGILNSESWKDWLALPKKSKKSWQKSHFLALKARALGLPLTFFQKVLFVWPYDLGLGLILYGLKSLARDRPLARTCLIRGTGKFFSLLSLSY
jgi:glycosyltransferase involved in cell wall biosynthesis